MKNIIGMMALMLIFVAGVSSAANLITNGDFSLDVNSDNMPDDWGQGKHLSWETEGENRFIRITSLQAGKMFLIYREMAIPTDVKALELSFRGRCSNFKRGKKNWFDARIIMNFLDAAGRKVGTGPAPRIGKNTKGWVEKKVDFLVPKGAVKLILMPCLFNVTSGTFDIDDIKLVAVSPEPIIQRKKEAAEKKAKDVARRAAMVKPQVAVTPKDRLPPELKVVGNKIQTKDGNEVWLQGVCVDSMEWCAAGERILQSVGVAIKDWKANCIRLPIKEHFYNGNGPYQKDGGAGYRQLIDDVINYCGARGVYVIIDLHRFRAPEQKHADFWKEFATKYKDHPVVLFELFNEPHDISWEVWRNGGFVTDKKRNTEIVTENKEKLRGFKSIGMQKLVDAVRDTGAKNIVIVSGVDWSYDLTGIMKGFAVDDRGGNGVMYTSHNYPWKKDWQKFMCVIEKYPLFIGEVGNLRKWEDFSFIGPSQRYEKVGPESAWPGDMIGLMQKYKIHWTGFSFHPKCGPAMLLDWDYNPTPYWGKFVKEALGGKQFELKKMR